MAYKIFSKKGKRAFKSGFFHFARGSKGQVILEYVLLLIVSVTMAQLLIAMVDLDASPPSHFSRYWKRLLEVVGADIST